MQRPISRRRILSVLGAAPAFAGAGGNAFAQAKQQFHHRQLGRTGRWVVPLGLGGQGALQWTPDGVDPVAIIVRAVKMGINYLDTANAYGASQANYGKAFQKLNLIPGRTPFNAALRERLTVATKTKARYALNPEEPDAPTAISEMKHSLSVMFGDGKGAGPRGAYLDTMQIHNVQTLADVDAVYEGLAERESGKVEKVGAIAGLLDYRDGTNYTGLNPEHRICLRQIGISGHLSSLILMNALQRDTLGVLDTLLVALNPNDRRYCAHQNNVLPLARAKGIGVIAMKAFADGAFYGKEPRFSRSPDDVVQTVAEGDRLVSPWNLVRYPVSLPGVSCLITGIGSMNAEDPEQDQLTVNLTAALSDLAGEAEMRHIERLVGIHHGKNTNYFQAPSTGLVQPGDVKVSKEGDRIRVSWHTALAGAEPIRSYVVVTGNKELLRIPFRPQTSLNPLSVTLPATQAGSAPITVVASNLPPWMRTQ